MAAAAKAATGVARARQPESTRRMAALLEKITREADPLRNPFRNVEQVAILSRMQSEATEPAALLKIRMQLAWQYLDAGNPDEALKEYEAIQQVMEDNRVPPAERQEPEWLTFAAMCHLRMGENENCCANHNADSCLFPIHGKGIHTLQRGSRGAVGVLTELLEKYPGDLRARWLLNVAYMTLGEYPDKVPVKWLLLEDFDNDGFLDLMVSSWGVRDQLRLFRNNGNGTFTERTEEAGLTGLTGGLNLIHCDYNNDGFMDVLVLRGAWLGTEGHYPCSLLRNNGDFTFTDVTEEAGLLRFHPTNSAVWFDYNGDGWIDLFIANESKAGDRNPCELFRNNGDGTFTECAAENGVDLVGFYKAVASADFNNDGRPDLFLSRLDGPKVLLRNDGAAGADRSARRGGSPTWPRRRASPGRRRPSPAGSGTTTMTDGPTSLSRAMSSRTWATSPRITWACRIPGSAPSCTATTGTARSPMPRRNAAWTSCCSRWEPILGTWTTTAGWTSTLAPGTRSSPC